MLRNRLTKCKTSRRFRHCSLIEYFPMFSMTFSMTMPVAVHFTYRETALSCPPANTASRRLYHTARILHRHRSVPDMPLWRYYTNAYYLSNYGGSNIYLYSRGKYGFHRIDALAGIKARQPNLITDVIYWHSKREKPLNYRWHFIGRYYQDDAFQRRYRIMISFH